MLLVGGGGNVGRYNCSILDRQCGLALRLCIELNIGTVWHGEIFTLILQLFTVGMIIYEYQRLNFYVQDDFSSDLWSIYRIPLAEYVFGFISVLMGYENLVTPKPARVK